MFYCVYLADKDKQEHPHGKLDLSNDIKAMKSPTSTVGSKWVQLALWELPIKTLTDPAWTLALKSKHHSGGHAM